MKLFHHETDGGAVYLTDVGSAPLADGTREGLFKGAKYVVRLDGDIRRDAELTVRDPDDDLDAEQKKFISEAIAHSLAVHILLAKNNPEYMTKEELRTYRRKVRKICKQLKEEEVR